MVALPSIARLRYNAGLDLFMAPDSWKGLYENTIERRPRRPHPEARIDDAVRRILRVKAKLGLLDGRPIRDVPGGTGQRRRIGRLLARLSPKASSC